MDGVKTNHHRPLINKPSWRLLVLRMLPLRRRVLWLTPLHMLVQIWAREDRATSRGLRHIILQPSREEGIELIEADHWFQQVGKILEVMEITSDAMRIRLAAFQLEGESEVWWDWVKASRSLEAITWEEFRELFMGKYFLASARHVKAREFLELKQGTMTVLEFVAKFTELAHFVDYYVATDMAKVRKFEDGLKLSIRGKIVGLLLQDMTRWSGQLWP